VGGINRHDNAVRCLLSIIRNISEDREDVSE
jgi:hypothetical protein